MEDNVRNIRNILAQGKQQLKQAMEILQNNAGINGANGSKRQQTEHKRHDEEFTDCLREYQELGLAFHADMSFKDFCTIKHLEWYEPQLSVDKKVKVPRKKVDGAYGEETPSTDVEDSTSYLISDAHDNEDVHEELVADEIPCEVDLISQEMCIRDEREVVGFEEVCSHGSPTEMDLISQEVFLSDVGQRGTTDVGEYSDEDSTVDLGSRSHEVALQHDVDVCSCESHHLTGQLKVHEDMIVAAMRHLDDTHTLVADFCWTTTMVQDNLGGDLSLVDFITLKEAMVVTRSNYLHLLADRDYLLAVSGVYQGALEGKEHEVDRLTRELVNTQDSLESTQMVLQKSELQVEQLQEGVESGISFIHFSRHSVIYISLLSGGCQ
jgi:hypothetical protein